MLSVAGRRTERGSIALVTLVLVVMALLAAAFIDRVTSEGRRVADHGDRVAALQAADGGLAEALARVAAGESAAFRTVGGSDPERGWTVEASPASAERWEVRSTGRAGEVTMALRADVVAEAGRWRIAGWEELGATSGG